MGWEEDKLEGDLAPGGCRESSAVSVVAEELEEESRLWEEPELEGAGSDLWG